VKRKHEIRKLKGDGWEASELFDENEGLESIWQEKLWRRWFFLFNGDWDLRKRQFDF